MLPRRALFSAGAASRLKHEREREGLTEGYRSGNVHAGGWGSVCGHSSVRRTVFGAKPCGRLEIFEKESLFSGSEGLSHFLASGVETPTARRTGLRERRGSRGMRTWLSIPLAP